VIRFEDWTLHGVWGSPPRFRGPAEGVVVHHSVTNAGSDAKAAARIVEHVIHRRGGFSMIAYSYLLHPDGTVFEGRGSDYRNGANRNDKGGRFANSNTVSVCCIGDYRTDRITQPQQQAFARLMSDLRRDGIITVDAELLAHRDLAYTQCPAGAYEQLLTEPQPEIDIAAVLRYLHYLSEQVAARPLSRAKRSTGDAVKVVQERLKRPATTLARSTASSDRKPSAAVESFQRASGLTVDGIVGPATWAALLS
jgi:hypothetical protein